MFREGTIAMPLSQPTEREELHHRRYDFRGFRRADGLWDIEGRLCDIKAYPFENEDRGTIQPGEALHDMEIRLTIGEDFVVRDVEATTNSGPFHVCPAIAPNYRKLIGKRLGAGWRRTLRDEVGGTEGCTHLTEMLGAMATVAFQTLYPVLASEGKLKAASGRRPPLIDSCHAFRSDGPVVKREWPEHYSGPGRTAGDDEPEEIASGAAEAGKP